MGKGSYRNSPEVWVTGVISAAECRNVVSGNGGIRTYFVADGYGEVDGPGALLCTGIQTLEVPNPQGGVDISTLPSSDYISSSCGPRQSIQPYGPKIPFPKFNSNIGQGAYSTAKCVCSFSGETWNGSICTKSVASIAFLSGPIEIRPGGTGGTATLSLTARVIDGTTAQPGVPVQFTAEVAAKSGGHDHDDVPRPKGSLSIAQGITDGNGEVQVTFIAPQIAGLHTVKAICTNCSNSPASKQIQVKVPDLVNIFTLPFRDAQWAFPGIGQTGEHSDNHYVTIGAATRMLDISRKYQKIWPTAPKLTLNDASLVWGGKFDIKGTWERNPKAHAEHRIGDNMDIRANSAPGAVPANIRELVFRWLRNTSRPADNIPADFVIDTVDPLWENPGDINEHFHLRLGK